MEAVNKEFVQNLPKIELHAHLNGSLSNSTLLKLYKLKNDNVDKYSDFYKILKNDKLTMQELVFYLLNKLMK